MLVATAKRAYSRSELSFCFKYPKVPLALAEVRPPFLPSDFVVSCFDQSEFFYGHGANQGVANGIQWTGLKCPRVGPHFSLIRQCTVSFSNKEGVSVSKKIKRELSAQSDYGFCVFGPCWPKTCRFVTLESPKTEQSSESAATGTSVRFVAGTCMS